MIKASQVKDIAQRVAAFRSSPSRERTPGLIVDAAALHLVIRSGNDTCYGARSFPEASTSAIGTLARYVYSIDLNDSQRTDFDGNVPTEWRYPGE